jgi:hypothetical protein
MTLIQAVAIHQISLIPNNKINKKKQNNNEVTPQNFKSLINQKLMIALANCKHQNQQMLQ